MDKTCTKCHRSKASTEFHRNRKMRDGLSSWCSACHRQSTRDSRAKYPGRYRYDDYNREYRRRTGLDKVRCANVKAKELGLSERLTVADWADVVKSQRGQCAHCTSRIEELDHIVAFVYGGSNTRANIQGLCNRCHGAKSISEDKYARAKQLTLQR